MNKLRLMFPKQMAAGYTIVPVGEATPIPREVRLGEAKDVQIKKGIEIHYSSPRAENITTERGIYKDLNTSYYIFDGNGSLNLHERHRGSHNHLISSHQILKKSDVSLIKKNNVYSAVADYSAIHCQNYRTGIETVVYKNGNTVIVRYDILPNVKAFAKGLKGKLQKLGMAIATDSNGCERAMLNKLGEMVLNLAQKLK